MKPRRAGACLLAVLGVLGILAGCTQPDPALPPPSQTPSLEPTRGLPTLGPAPTSTPGSNCVVVSQKPTPGPTEPSLFPAVSDSDWVEGKADAAVTIVMYFDFQCPYCAQLEPVLAALLEAYPSDLRLVYRHYPLEGHDKAVIAAQAAEAAAKQNPALFFAVKDRLYAKQTEWVGLSQEAFLTWLEQQMTELSFDPDQFEMDLKDSALLEKIRQAQAAGLAIGIPGTPFLLINGDPYQGPRDYISLEMVINLLKLENRQYSECPPDVLNPAAQYQAVLVMEAGEIVIQLLPENAPLAVNNFVFLARNGWYNGNPFFRVIPGYYAQTGDPSGTGYGGPGFTYVNEIDPTLLFDSPGIVAMSNFGSPNSNGSQFFITLNALPELNGMYTIFGYVIGGMEILEALPERDPAKGGDLQPAARIVEVRIEEKLP